MAEQDEELQLETGGNKKKIIIIASVAAVLLIIVSVVLYFVFSGNDSASPQTDVAVDTQVSQQEVSEEDRGAAYYVAMPRPFVFNVPGQKRERLVQIKVQLMVRGLDNEEAAKTHVPMVEGRLLTVFSHANAEDLVTEAGKTALRKQALKEVQMAFQNIEGRKVVERVLFTGFVMQ